MLSALRLNLAMLVASALLFLLSFAANQWLFFNAEYVRGIHWIYLPAGMRLLCTLLFGGAGALGVLVATWLTCFYYSFPGNLERAAAGAVISAAAPYLVYLLAQRYSGLQTSLANLSSRRLLWLILLYAMVCPLLYHLWFWWRGAAGDLLAGLAVMFIGDLLGSLLLVYAIKLLLLLRPAWLQRQK